MDFTEYAKAAYYNSRISYLNKIKKLIHCSFLKTFGCKPDYVYTEIHPIKGTQFFVEREGVVLSCEVGQIQMEDNSDGYYITFYYKNKPVYSLADLGRLL